MTPRFEDSDVDIRAASYLIARTVGSCGHCGRPTVLVALCLPPGHERLDDDDVWSRTNHHVFLFHVDNLSDAAQQRVQDIAPCYDFQGESPGAEWSNHCEHCGTKLDDLELYCEPGGAFLPVSPAGARVIRLVPVDEGVAARAAGLADEPEFFDFMSRA